MFRFGVACGLISIASLASAQTLPSGNSMRFAEESEATVFSAPDAWRDRSDVAGPLDATNHELTLIFRPRLEGDYTVTNDLGSDDAPLEVHGITLAPPGTPSAGKPARAQIVGRPIRLLPGATGQLPLIVLGARHSTKALSFDVGTEIRFAPNLLIRGEGNQSFQVSGVLRGEEPTAGLIKEGASTLTLRGEGLWLGITLVKKGLLELHDGLCMGTGALKIEPNAAVSLEPQAPHAGLSTALDVAERGRLDLNGGAWVLDYTGESPAVFIQSMVRGGRIMSSNLAVNQAIACVEASALQQTEYAGRALDKDALVIAVARPGDTNLDFKVDVDDLHRIKAAFNHPGTWSEGDVTGDGRVDFDDLLRIAQNYDSKESFDADWKRAQ